MKTDYRNAAIWSLFSALLVIISCEKDVKVKNLPTVDPQPVVQCYLSPQDDTIHVYVGFSIPYFNEFYSTEARRNLLKTAKIRLSGNGQSVILTRKYTMYDTYIYTIEKDSFEIKAGMKYSLDCSFVNGMATSAQCTIPTDLPNDIIIDNTVVLPPNIAGQS
jgi:hypothetical protein